MGYQLMILFAQRSRSKASQPAVCPLAIPYDVESKRHSLLGGWRTGIELSNVFFVGSQIFKALLDNAFLPEPFNILAGVADLRQDFLRMLTQAGRLSSP